MSTWTQIAFYSIVGCVFMAIQDVGYTLNARAVAKSKPWLAGWMNGMVDISAFAILSFIAGIVWFVVKVVIVVALIALVARLVFRRRS